MIQQTICSVMFVSLLIVTPSLVAQEEGQAKTSNAQEYDKALKQYQLIYPSDAARPAIYQGDYDSARKTYQEALQEYQSVYPSDAARAAIYRGDYKSALRTYQSLLDGTDQKVSPFWIGVQCESAGEVPVLSDLPHIGRLFHKGGLKVNSITDDSPAQSAGIREGDVIVAFNGKLVNEISELLAAIGESKTSEVEVQVIRSESGEGETLTIKPAKRPEQDESKKATDGATYQAWQHYWLAQQADPRTAATSRYWLAAFYGLQQLPDDVEVSFSKKGKEQAAIAVKRGEKEWQVKNDADVRKLPADVQAFVMALRNSTNTATGAYRYWNQGTRNWNQGIRHWNQDNVAAIYSRAYLDAIKPLDVRTAETTNEKLDLIRRIDAMSKQIEALRKSIQDLKDD